MEENALNDVVVLFLSALYINTYNDFRVRAVYRLIQPEYRTALLKTNYYKPVKYKCFLFDKAAKF